METSNGAGLVPEKPRGAEFPRSERTRVRRLPQRASYDRDAVYGVLDAGLVAHVGYLRGGEPVVLPFAYARVGDEIVLHGSTRAGLLEAMADGQRICLSVTHLDGLVLARSAFHHSVNYRSATVFGRARVLESEEEKDRALAAFTEKIVPGRWDEVRPPTPKELRATTVVALAIEEAVAKARSGGPLDDAEDLELPVWAGVIPLALVPGEPVADPALPPGIPATETIELVREARRRAAPIAEAV
ncbi:MAG TPA: pyridoxamine 5'-phosphate oxidase family protein [Candidatus Binatia bacterium]|nr:pyridoxamine 5'-phosphate oxidase family protein [Candidatus Binatia bacterium]